MLKAMLDDKVPLDEKQPPLKVPVLLGPVGGATGDGEDPMLLDPVVAAASNALPPLDELPSRDEPVGGPAGGELPLLLDGAVPASGYAEEVLLELLPLHEEPLPLHEPVLLGPVGGATGDGEDPVLLDPVVAAASDALPPLDELPSRDEPVGGPAGGELLPLGVPAEAPLLLDGAVPASGYAEELVHDDYFDKGFPSSARRMAAGADAAAGLCSRMELAAAGPSAAVSADAAAGPMAASSADAHWSQRPLAVGACLCAYSAPAAPAAADGAAAAATLGDAAAGPAAGPVAAANADLTGLAAAGPVAAASADLASALAAPDVLGDAAAGPVAAHVAVVAHGIQRRLAVGACPCADSALAAPAAADGAAASATLGGAAADRGLAVAGPVAAASADFAAAAAGPVVTASAEAGPEAAASANLTGGRRVVSGAMQTAAPNAVRAVTLPPAAPAAVGAGAVASVTADSALAAPAAADGAAASATLGGAAADSQVGLAAAGPVAAASADFAVGACLCAYSAPAAPAAAGGAAAAATLGDAAAGPAAGPVAAASADFAAAAAGPIVTASAEAGPEAAASANLTGGRRVVSGAMQTAAPSAVRAVTLPPAAPAAVGAGAVASVTAAGLRSQEGVVAAGDGTAGDAPRDAPPHEAPPLLDDAPPHTGDETPLLVLEALLPFGDVALRVSVNVLALGYVEPILVSDDYFDAVFGRCSAAKHCAGPRRYLDTHRASRIRPSCDPEGAALRARRAAERVLKRLATAAVDAAQPLLSHRTLRGRRSRAVPGAHADAFLQLGRARLCAGPRCLARHRNRRAECSARCRRGGADRVAALLAAVDMAQPLLSRQSLRGPQAPMELCPPRTTPRG
jgi:hypothetical protein